MHGICETAVHALAKQGDSLLPPNTVNSLTRPQPADHALRHH